ncbi:MAG: hypothetical protein JNM47_07120 [Hyphomonadaceae bacterium]|nr:hypothetical protein [Hyphomonadaceae bacterium]
MTESSSSPAAAPGYLPFAVWPWAAWPAPMVQAAFTSGLGCWIAVNRAWLDAACTLLRRQDQEDAMEAEDPLVHMTLEGLRSCGDAMLDAQIETLESWRRVS